MKRLVTKLVKRINHIFTGFELHSHIQLRTDGKVLYQFTMESKENLEVQYNHKMLQAAIYTDVLKIRKVAVAYTVDKFRLVTFRSTINKIF